MQGRAAALIGERRDLPVRLQARFAAAQPAHRGNGRTKAQGGRELWWTLGDIIQAQPKLARKRNAKAVRYGRRIAARAASRLTRARGTAAGGAVIRTGR